MSLYNFEAKRVYVDTPLNVNKIIEASFDQVNYLVNVLRLKQGDTILLFNGTDGEWLAKITEATRKKCLLTLEKQARPQPDTPELWYAFAPIKSARLDYMVQKAVEMGVSKLIPVITRRTQAARLKLERMQANVIEAAEQCGILSIAEVEPEVKLEQFLERCRALSTVSLIFCDENNAVANPLSLIKQAVGRVACVLIGPEGGFDQAERTAIMNVPNSIPISLGPRILRADTAAVAALTAVQCAIGDWG